MTPPRSGATKTRSPAKNGRAPGTLVKVRRRQQPKLPAERGSFGARVLGTERDLMDIIENGIPPVEYLPGADGILIRGTRNQIAAFQKTGKSIGTLVLCFDMAMAGCRIAILDRENGTRTFADRLSAIIDARGSSAKEKQRWRENVRYLEFPQLRATDADDLVGWAMAKRLDLVVFDSQRMFLTDLRLSESNPDDYSKFMDIAIDPLFRAGIATLILDNTGFGDQTRSRSSSAKGDLNEVLFAMEGLGDDPSLKKQGRLRLWLEPGRSRYGHTGEWTLDIGGGVFGCWTSIEEGSDTKRAAFTETVLRVLAAVPDGLSQRSLFTAVREFGIKFENEIARHVWLAGLEHEGVLTKNTQGRYCLPGGNDGPREAERAARRP